MLHLIYYQSEHILVPVLYQLMDTKPGNLEGQYVLPAQLDCVCNRLLSGGGNK